MDLDFSFMENQHEARAFMYSAGVVVLSVIAIVAFIFSGGSIVFYAFAVLAVAVGIYMAYHISKAPVQAAAPTPATKRRQTKR